MGFFGVVPLITRNARKTHENTKKKKMGKGGALNVPSPVPHTKSTNTQTFGLLG